MDLYDTVIVGGGIAGLYAAWLIHKNHPNHKFIVLEKENQLGGRIFTYSDKNMCVEAGAARFNENHHQLIELIRELGLHKKMVKITSDAKFYPSDGINDTDTLINMLANPLKTVLELLINSKFSITSLIVRVIIYSKLFSKYELINTNFVSIARKTLSETEVQHIIDAFGFYTELVDMNAYDCINLMEGGLNPNQQFYTLRGGLSQIINVLYKKLKPRILTNVEITSISHNKNHFEIKTNKKTYYSLRCISAIPKQNIEAITFFKPIYKLTKFIECHPLCRIYSKFDMSDKRNTWITNLPKLTTNNNLRMVIPIDIKSGIIMVSYTDNKFADFWKSIEKKSGIPGVNKEISRLLTMSIGVDIPLPIYTKVFYWNCGVGYWGITADSAAIEQSILRPFPKLPLYICGEHYSSKHQQWIEGALDTSRKVVQASFSSSDL